MGAGGVEVGAGVDVCMWMEAGMLTILCNVWRKYATYLIRMNTYIVYST